MPPVGLLPVVELDNGYGAALDEGSGPNPLLGEETPVGPRDEVQFVRGYGALLVMTPGPVGSAVVPVPEMGTEPLGIREGLEGPTIVVEFAAGKGGPFVGNWDVGYRGVLEEEGAAPSPVPVEPAGTLELPAGYGGEAVDAGAVSDVP